MPLTIQGTLNTNPSIKLSQGNVTNPGLTFANATSTGLFASNTGTLGISSNGIHVANFSPEGVVVQTSLRATHLSGNGVGIYSVPLANTTGTLEENRLPANISGNGAGLYGILAANVLGLESQLININANSVTANHLSGNGFGIYSVPLANTTGLLEENRLPANISGNGSGLYGILAANVLGLQDALQNLSANSVAANHVSGNGFGLFAVPLANTTGTLEENRLPANISGNGFGLYGMPLANTTGTLEENRLPANISGNGSGLYGMPLANTTGTLEENRLPANISGNGFGIYGMPLANTTGILEENRLPANISGNGFGIYGMPLANTTGTLDTARLPANISGNGSGLYGILAANVLDLESQLTNINANSVTANHVAGNGFGIYSVPIANTTGTLDTARLPANIVGNGSGLYGILAANVLGLESQLTNINANSVTANHVAGNGFGLFAVPIANTTGTLDTTRLPSDITISGNISATSYTGNVDIGNLEIIFDSGGYFEANVGNITRPGYSFDMDTTTGFYSPQANTFAFVSGGAETAQIYPSGFAVNGAMTATSYYGNIDIGNVVLEIQDGGTFRANVGNGVQPGFSFVGDTSTGIYRPEPSKIGFVAGGVEKAQVSPTGLSVNGNVSALGNVSATYYTGNGSLLSGLTIPIVISNIQITSNTWTVLDDTAVPLEGGYCLVNGSGFAPGSLVTVGTDFASSTSYISSTQLKAQVPAKSSGSYNLSVIRGDTSSATLPLGITYSIFPAWSTSTDLGNVTQNISFTRTLAASSDSNVTYANTSALPPQTTLATNGTLSGNITSVADYTSYTFTIKATDTEFQDVPRTFFLQYAIPFAIGDLSDLSGSTNGSYSFIIAGRQAYGFGYNVFGQLGITTNAGTETGNPVPTNIMSRGSLVGKRVTKIACGSYHTMIVCQDGTLHAFGYNEKGQLGTTTSLGSYITMPFALTNGSLSGKIIVNVVCGYSQTMVLCSDGTLHSFGNNYYGQLGTSTNNSTNNANPTPVNISSNGSLSGKIISSISCGSDHTMVLCTDGSLHAFGRNDSGQLGTSTNSGTYNPNPTPINISSNGSLSGKTISAFSCGSSHTMVLCTDNTLHSFGDNGFGQLGTSTNFTLSNPNPTPVNITTNGSLSGKTISKVSCGSGYTLVLCTDGSVHSFGVGGNGQLGFANSPNYLYTPTNISSYGSLSGKTGSSIKVCGSQSFVLCTDKTLHGFGYNNYGQVGITGGGSIFTPTNITSAIVE